MITATSILGNIYRDASLKEKYRQIPGETVRISRLESQRVRMRKSSDKGTDIAIVLPPGSKLRHGDVVLLTADRMVVVELEPENVAVVEVKDNLHKDDLIEVPVRIGHTIGNLHRPIKLEGSRIYFPIQADSELEMFRKLFGHMNEHLEIRGARMVFEPEEGMDVHEH
ncbi:putative urease accessory protein UreE [Nitrososphaera viennensis EN76]|nr:putative urease accessory protein UreE [Nitrososphaera viennensis EN76]